MEKRIIKEIKQKIEEIAGDLDYLLDSERIK